MSRASVASTGVRSLAALAVVAALACAARPADAKPMDFTRGNDVGLQVIPLAEARLQLDALLSDAATQKVTAFESYVKWMLLEPEQGRWDFTYYDMVAAESRKHGMKWTPFLIAGPAYATPQWFKESKESVFARCLEHGEDTRTQSIWNPSMPARVDSLMRAFAKHFDHMQMQSLLLGISGDFGESIYTVSGNAWTYRWDGEYHHHRGWWCGDEYAVRDFRAAMRARYRRIGALNAAWGTALGGFDDVRPFLPDAAKTREARLDMARWYRGSMTRYAEMWVKTARKYLPDVQVMLCTGGEGTTVLGADFTEQAEMAAKHGAGMRITNEASDYAQNFMLTRLVGTACRSLGAYFGYEPAGEVTDDGLVARAFNVASSGASEWFTYDAPASGPRAVVYRRLHGLLETRAPLVRVAMFYCKTSESLGVPGFTKGGDDFYAHAAAFRDFSDLDFLDETLVAKGFLNRYKALVWQDGAVTDAHTLKTIEAWVKRGGRLYLNLDPEAVDGTAWSARLRRYPTVHVSHRADAAAWYAEIAASAPALFPDGKADGVYQTAFEDGGRLVYNANTHAITP
jgi:hypothetical protein